MKNNLIALTIVLLFIAFLLSANGVWTVVDLALLEKQSAAFAVAIQSRDIHTIHRLDMSIGSETVTLRKKTVALTDDQQKEYRALLTDIAAQAAASHHDAHAGKWEEAADAQIKLAADVKAAQVLFPPLPKK